MEPPALDPAPTSIPSGTPAWELVPADKKQQILDAAVSEFADRGYSRASMNQLVKSAGISKGSLFHYFRTKGDLFGGLVDAAFGQVKAQVKAVRDATSGEPLPWRLEQLLEAGLEFVSAHPRLARIYFRVLRSGDAPFGQQKLQELGEHSRRFLTELIEDAQARGEVAASVDAARTAWLIDAMLERLLAAWHESQLSEDMSDDDRDRERRAWVAAFRALVERGLPPGEAVGRE